MMIYRTPNCFGGNSAANRYQTLDNKLPNESTGYSKPPNRKHFKRETNTLRDIFRGLRQPSLRNLKHKFSRDSSAASSQDIPWFADRSKNVNADHIPWFGDVNELDKPWFENFGKTVEAAFRRDTSDTED